ncbi:Similar to S.cerevisiae protein HXK2 (Hexokinase isoenzyme 2) [Malassezia sympodialis ATCC 42132]|uniref:Phosphotransferase n=2 Tax=Malassezia sympodialis (strain ATCC 42132) TaxID=1230383 RepID=A0A1M8A273_MALS4|nr:Similar to S.cerevisiae protein HXK2 (Hexokinase isoenzyme 2) [Malassezia sympodialis ATCC 42132]
MSAESLDNVREFTRESMCFDTPATKNDVLEQQLKHFEDVFTVSGDYLREITDNFVGVLRQGLEKEDQVVPMLPTFVFGWPEGKEEGHFLSLDMGGTNIRVCLVELKGNRKFDLTQVKFRITDEQKHEDGSKLFDFCAKCVKDFITKHFGSCEKVSNPLSLGFTFSYPTVQRAIDHGELIRWTKGFSNPHTEGHDCADMLRQSLKKLDVPVELSSIINDTTGTLIASNYVDPSTKIAVILGTGCNAAYMEHIGEVPKIASLNLPSDEMMAINCEYGAFDSFDHKHLARVRNRYDEHIDLSSNKPHEQAFEKMIAGLYLGEIFRLIVCDLVYQNGLFLGQETYKLEKPYSFDTTFLSLIETDPTEELLTVMGLFKYFFSIETELEERQFFRRLAQLIGTRSARLSACGIAAIVKKKDLLADGGCTVGIDGSLYSKYPNFADRLHDALIEILGPEGKSIQTRQAEDGSGAGSAVIAAMTKARKDAGIYSHV